MASLWTPYADEALDLSNAAVKTEPVAPSPPLFSYMPTTSSPVPFYPAVYGYAPQTSPSATYGYAAQTSPSTMYGYAPQRSPGAICGYAPQPSPSPMYGYPAQMSPSSSSGHEEAKPVNQLQQRMTTLSPPDSPDTDHNRQSLTRLSNHVDMEFLTDDPKYQVFERDALKAMAEKNGGTLLGNNPRMRRSVRSTRETADDSYRQQRERNNFAAKQSRDRRKLREVRLALKVTYLEKEAAKLKAMLASGMCVRCNSFRG